MVTASIPGRPTASSGAEAQRGPAAAREAPQGCGRLLPYTGLGQQRCPSSPGDKQRAQCPALLSHTVNDPSFAMWTAGDKLRSRTWGRDKRVSSATGRSQKLQGVPVGVHWQSQEGKSAGGGFPHLHMPRKTSRRKQATKKYPSPAGRNLG